MTSGSNQTIIPNSVLLNLLILDKIKAELMIGLILGLLILFWIFGYIHLPFLDSILFSVASQPFTLHSLLLLILIIIVINFLPGIFRVIVIILLLLWLLSVFGIFSFLGGLPQIIIIILILVIIFSIL